MQILNISNVSLFFGSSNIHSEVTSSFIGERNCKLPWNIEVQLYIPLFLFMQYHVLNRTFITSCDVHIHFLCVIEINISSELCLKSMNAMVCEQNS